MLKGEEDEIHQSLYLDTYAMLVIIMYGWGAGRGRVAQKLDGEEKELEFDGAQPGKNSWTIKTASAEKQSYFSCR